MTLKLHILYHGFEKKFLVSVGVREGAINIQLMGVCILGERGPPFAYAIFTTFFQVSECVDQ